MTIKGVLNWLLSAILFAAGTTLSSLAAIPDLERKHVLAIAGSTFVAALLSHLRQSPFSASASS